MGKTVSRFGNMIIHFHILLSYYYHTTDQSVLVMGITIESLFKFTLTSKLFVFDKYYLALTKLSCTCPCLLWMVFGNVYIYVG